MLRDGHADFYIDDDAEVDFLLASLEQHADLRVTELQLLPLYLAFARTERGRALKQLYEQRMDVLVRNGSLRAIFKRWKDHYPYDSAQEPHHGTP
jgi:polar amino acid transport system substrate-binding protein